MSWWGSKCPWKECSSFDGKCRQLFTFDDLTSTSVSIEVTLNHNTIRKWMIKKVWLQEDLHYEYNITGSWIRRSIHWGWVVICLLELAVHVEYQICGLNVSNSQTSVLYVWPKIVSGLWVLLTDEVTFGEEPFTKKRSAWIPFRSYWSMESVLLLF